MLVTESFHQEAIGNQSAVIQGWVFDIDRYAIHDGPGIRCLIFMKGCRLRCLWCSNPEGQNFYPEVGYFPAKCIGCGMCADSCPQNVIRMEGGRPITDWNLCDNCGKCTEKCYSGARKLFGRLMSVEELFKEVQKNVVFFVNSGGGVTVGGGDATAQPEFVSDFLKKCKSENIHTVIETSGFCTWENLKKISLHTDLVFYDIKQMDPEKHKNYTKVSNKRILRNLIKLSREAVDLIIRVPVVPGYNDDEDNIRSTAKFIVEELELSRLKRVELLPYFKFGVFKYDRLGRTYNLKSIDPPSDEKMEALKELIESYQLPCQVGG